MIESVIMFDFDDTLFPTSYLFRYNYDFKLFDKSIEQAVFNILTKAVETKASVYIITNAGYDWVDYCLRSMMPRIKEMELKGDIKVLSAVDIIKKTNIDDPTINIVIDSKRLVVEQLIAMLNKNKQYQLLSFGDGEPEVIACKSIQKKFKNVRVKITRFSERPSSNDLLGQLRSIFRYFDNLFETQEELDLFTIKNDSELNSETFFDKQFQEEEDQLYSW